MNVIGYVIAIIILAIIVVFTAKGIKIVPESRVYVIERLGKYSQGLQSGLSFINPFFDRVAKVISLKEQVVDFPPQPVITKDNATMQIDTIVYFQITDPKLYTYGVERPLAAIENLTATTLRNIIGDMTVDQTLTSRDTINTAMRAELDEATKNQLAQGERIREILKQPNYKPMPVEYQIVIIFAATKKLLLDVPTDKVLEFQDKLFRFIESKHPEIAAEIRDKKEISDDLAKRLTDVINECKKA